VSVFPARNSVPRVVVNLCWVHVSFASIFQVREAKVLLFSSYYACLVCFMLWVVDVCCLLRDNMLFALL